MFDSTRHLADRGALVYAKSEILIGTVVGSVPLWADRLHSALSWVALLCAAILGLHGVARIVSHRWRQWQRHL